MNGESTLTARGLLTIPREIRERIGLKAGDKVSFSIMSNGTVVLRAKTRHLGDAAGMLTRDEQPSVVIDAMKP